VIVSILLQATFRQALVRTLQEERPTGAGGCWRNFPGLGRYVALCILSWMGTYLARHAIILTLGSRRTQPLGIACPKQLSKLIHCDHVLWDEGVPGVLGIPNYFFVILAITFTSCVLLFKAWVVSQSRLALVFSCPLSSLSFGEWAKWFSSRPFCLLLWNSLFVCCW